MFFEARERFAQQRPNEYVRGLLSQYGNRGKPVQLPRAPSHTDARHAVQFRQRELEQLKYTTERAKALEAQLRQSRKDARVLAQYAQQFLGKSANDRRRRDGPPDGHTRSAPVLHTASRPADADNAHGPQEINSDPIVVKGDERATVSRSGRRASVVFKKEDRSSSGNVQQGSVRAADDGEREPEGAADHTGQAGEHDAA